MAPHGPLLEAHGAVPFHLAVSRSFLGGAPDWYKLTILGFLVLNPALLATLGPTLSAWLIVLEFIFTLAMALKCYPLQPGGLLALEAIVLGLASPITVFEEAEAAFDVILLLIFMVAGIFFLKDLLLFTFTKILLGVRSKALLSLMFCGAAAFLSAFLDALTVTAVVITVMHGFYAVYHRVASGLQLDEGHDVRADSEVQPLHREDLVRFRAFLRSLAMHAAVGTALGGVTTVVGEPQNLLIGTAAGWEFVEFFVRMAPVSLPVFVAGFITCALLERFRIFGYGARLPDPVRAVLDDFERQESWNRSPRETVTLATQALVIGFLIASLAFQLAKVGIVGLAVIVLATALTGVTEERRLGHAFKEALPFTALLVVFFGIVAVIEEQHLFEPIIEWALTLPETLQPTVFFLANGVLSAISDNVFVATVYMGEVEAALQAGTIDRAQFDLLAIAINTGTNLPSVATPNGQAAFLFLLTSTLAPLLRLSYVRMVFMAFPYAVMMTITGLLAVMHLL
ncbi:MAG: sodium/proton antiporter NhaB [Gammaproteobacteria bacterium]|nr:sodium/proton antiporter NhaB [Gammaproteobacteria bacterium]